MTSLRKLAKHLGLSHATVSAALRGLPAVKASTRERVLHTAEQYGYRVNPLASALMASMRRSESEVFRGVLVLLRPMRPRGLEDADERMRRRIASGAEQRARELGFDLQEIQVGANGCDPEKLHDILVARGVLGAVMLVPPEEGPSWRRIDRDCIPCVCMGHRLAGLDFVGPDHEEAIGLALSQVRAGGGGRVGLALARTGGRWRQLAWISAFYAKQLSLGAVPENTGVSSFFLYDESAEDLFRDWFETGRYDALISDAALPDSWHRRLLASVRDPKNVCFLDLDGSRGRGPRIDLRWDEIGRKSVDLLAGRILTRKNGRVAHPTATLCSPNWLAEADAVRLVA